ncbi:MAG: aspartyl/glutamyl-tRNA amidotransferase subunit A [Anaerolineales bacterium]|jgi:aspartyl-tRNA(Asn)/glutamyl-tRNA(Gln) amidotransferase subunit A|nr:aspartyl/glutamyl-tRNA amidotransferase subunit A [Anaerolineales bacterium]MCW5886908.1 aspartyl/glutamyl-tRNA amidotransferase subunit A [Anaerolineales bacterium]
MHLADLSAHQLAELVKKKEVSALEATEAALERVRAVDGEPGRLDGPADDVEKVHAFITVTDERARQQAKDIDARLAKGEVPGPLAGVPYTVKDIFAVKDVLTTAASRILSNFVAPYTATPVARMDAAGAVMLGKVNLDEFTYGSSNESSAYQPAARNPWNPAHVPGGSSGGSAAAVAAGEGALSLGTDTAGSIRQPAAFCGIVGMKPTYGRVSRYGLIAFGSSLDCPGPMARNVRDTALMLNAIAGPDPRDSTAAATPASDYTAALEEGVKGLRIGLSPDYDKITFFNAETGEIDSQPLPKEIAAAVLRAADKLSDAGARIIENVPMPHTRYGIPAYFVISRVEAASNLHRFDGVKYGYRTALKPKDLRDLYRKTRAEGFGPQPKLRILMGMYVSAAQYSEQYYHRALQVRSLIRGDFDTAFDANGTHKLDALLTATTPTTAFPVGDIYGDSVLMQYADQLAVPANHAGVPAISLPAGLSGDKLPLGIQLVGPDFSEATLLRTARAYEAATEGDAWRSERPQVLANI